MNCPLVGYATGWPHGQIFCDWIIHREGLTAKTSIVRRCCGPCHFPIYPSPFLVGCVYVLFKSCGQHICRRAHSKMLNFVYRCIL
ncbi:hypothetical protein XENTR_v10017056 [Xenopus tropicalis]|nr:hypothetical protein XENTR_v10017056 [Xenopus tropicalis]